MNGARAVGQHFGWAWPQVLRPCTDLISSIVSMSQTPSTHVQQLCGCPFNEQGCVLMLPSLGRLALFTLLCNEFFRPIALQPNHFLSEDRGYFLSIFVSLDLSTENSKVLQTYG